jgi:hypothetical protein
MRTLLVVVADVLSKDLLKVSFAENEHVVQTLMAHGEGYIYPSRSN